MEGCFCRQEQATTRTTFGCRYRPTLKRLNPHLPPNHSRAHPRAAALASGVRQSDTISANRSYPTADCVINPFLLVKRQRWRVVLLVARFGYTFRYLSFGGPLSLIAGVPVIATCLAHEALLALASTSSLEGRRQYSSTILAGATRTQHPTSYLTKSWSRRPSPRRRRSPLSYPHPRCHQHYRRLAAAPRQPPVDRALRLGSSVESLVELPSHRK